MILSTAYLGNIQYYTKLLSDLTTVDLYENYQKQSYRNRCDILAANGPAALVVPVLQPSGQKVPVRDIRIDNSKKWQHQHLQAIVSAYRSSPYFAHYGESLSPFYAKRYEFLADLNMELQAWVLGQLHADPSVACATAYCDVPVAEDFRGCISPKARLSRPDPDFTPVPYYQVFAERYLFVPNLSIIDLLFCEGPAAGIILKESSGL